MSQCIITFFIFIFSSRYAHILTYLRSPPSTAECSAVLPHGVRLNGSHCRIEALLELRDEAIYLGLEELQRLCTDELRHRHQASPTNLGGLGLHMRALSNTSNKSLHTLREAEEPTSAEEKAAQRKSDDSGFASSGAGTRKSGGSSEAEGPWPSPPGLKQRAALKEGGPKDHAANMKARPTGAWI